MSLSVFPEILLSGIEMRARCIGEFEDEMSGCGGRDLSPCHSFKLQCVSRSWLLLFVAVVGDGCVDRWIWGCS